MFDMKFRFNLHLVFFAYINLLAIGKKNDIPLALIKPLLKLSLIYVDVSVLYR